MARRWIRTFLCVAVAAIACSSGQSGTETGQPGTNTSTSTRGSGGSGIYGADTSTSGSSGGAAGEAGAGDQGTHACQQPDPVGLDWKAAGADELLSKLGYRGPGDELPPTLTCSVEDVSADGAEGLLWLACALPDGDSAEVQLSVTPAPNAAIAAFEGGVALVANYTPGVDCSLTCYAWGGWVAVRSADDDTLVLGLSMSHREPARPADLFAPLEFELDAGDCPTETQGFCDEGWEDAWRKGQYLVVQNGNELARIPAGDERQVGTTLVRVGLAEDAYNGSCCFDCGDAGVVTFMLQAPAEP